MARNKLPAAIVDLFTLAEDMADGANQYGTAVGLKQNDEAAIRAAKTAAAAAENEYLAAKTAKRTLHLAQNAADENARAFIGLAGTILGNYLGSQWTMAWSATGFPNQSTGVPRTIAQRQTLLQSLQTYFTNHPAHENAPLNITAARAGTLFTAMSDARSAVNMGLTALGQKRIARDAARKMLERRMRGLIDELELLIADDDPRWLAFGLNMPSADVTPEAPSDLMLIATANNMVSVDWTNVTNADHYRVYVAIGAGNENFVAEPTARGDSDATLGPYLPGQTIRVKVAAVSGSLEGPASDVAEVVLAGGGSGAPPTP